MFGVLLLCVGVALHTQQGQPNTGTLRLCERLPADPVLIIINSSLSSSSIHQRHQRHQHQRHQHQHHQMVFRKALLVAAMLAAHMLPLVAKTG